MCLYIIYAEKMVIYEPVQAAIWHCLNHYAYSDASFLAERLYSEVGTDEALFLLATCYYRAGKPVRAYSLLQNAGCPTSQCRFLMAQCCLEINKLSEAETALTGNILQRNSKNIDDIPVEFGETACFALRLLANIYNKTERTSKAADCHKKSLKLNPFLWSSYENLCKLGEKPDPSKTFQVHAQTFATACPSNGLTSPQVVTPSVPRCRPVSAPSETITLATQHTQDLPLVTLNSPQIISPEVMAVDVTPSDGSTMPPPHAPTTRARVRPQLGRNLLSISSPLTPSFGVLPLEATPSPAQTLAPIPFTPSPIPSQVDNYTSGSQDNQPRAPAKKPMTRRSQQQSSSTQNKPPVFSLSSSNTNAARDVQTPSSQGYQSGPALRRSSRLSFSSASSSVKENNKNQSQRKFTSPKAPAKKTKSKLSKTPQELNEINKGLELGGVNEIKPTTMTDSQEHVIAMQKHSSEGLMQLLQLLGKAYNSLCQYDCTRAIQLFQSLPPRHYNTGWVMCQVGRAYFEMAEYQKAEKLFSDVRQSEPYHLEGMETYSTTLWHLQREVQLSTLAQELVELDKNAPESWCATGNCFSLQKEHDMAIKFFQRAVQVDPDFAYAYTLLGHEYVLTEELDKALACFRNAIRVDPKHYNAWYGVGMVYYKQEKFSLAEVHFRRALSINPQSSVLLCHIGVVQHALKKSDTALVTLNKAIASDPKNPLCKFHRASILFANDRHKEALKELEELKEIVPRESLVYFLIGKVHKKLGNTHLALMNFSWAMDLDPKGANNQIKEAIDKRYVNEEDDPSMALGDASTSAIEEERSSNNSSLMDADDVQLQAIESDESL